MIGKPFWPSIAGLLFVCFNSLGCASLLNYPNDGRLRFTSNEEGVAITIIERQTGCQAPCELNLPREKFVVVAEKEGFLLNSKPTQRRISLPFIGNLFFGAVGLAFMAIDYYAGNMWVWSNDHLHFDMEELPADDDDSTEEIAKSPELPPAHDNIPQRIKDQFPAPFVLRQIQYYYGISFTEDEELDTLSRVYHQLVRMLELHERLDIDEAIRRDLVQEGLIP